MQRKPLKVKNNYWDGKTNPGITDFLCFNKDLAASISFHVQCQCFHYVVTSKKSPLNEIDVQMTSIHLFLIILIVFIMICIMKDAHWLLEIWVFVTTWQRKISGPKITQGEKLQTLLFLWNITPKKLTNHVKNIPKKP